jgi:nucleotide-binding universal stress UspA family protein
MIMFERILVPLDGSPRAEQALPVAARLAQAAGGSVVLVQVVSPPTDFGGGLAPAPLLTEQIIEYELAEASDYLKMMACSLTFEGIDTTTEVLFGSPAQHILATAQARAADLIVLCSHGRTGFMRWVLGSVAHQLIHHSPVPVLVLHQGKSLPGADAARPLCALVALDGSPLAETALVPAADLVTALAAPVHGVLHLLQVVKRFSTTAGEDFVTQLNAEATERAKAYLVMVKERLQEQYPRLTITWSVARAADVADVILSTAEQQESAEGFGSCELIAMATHGRGGWERWVMGSVTERVLHATRLPMLIVRPQQLKQK